MGALSRLTRLLEAEARQQTVALIGMMWARFAARYCIFLQLLGWIKTAVSLRQESELGIKIVPGNFARSCTRVVSQAGKALHRRGAVERDHQRTDLGEFVGLEAAASFGNTLPCLLGLVPRGRLIWIVSLTSVLSRSTTRLAAGAT